MRAGGEVLVPPSAAAAFGNNKSLVRLGKVVDQFSRLLVVKRCAHRYLQDYRLAIQAGAIGAHSVLAPLPFMFRVVPEMNEGIVPLRRNHDYVAATSSVPARRTATRDKFLTPESHAAIAAVSSLHPNFRFIDKHKQPGKTD
jgi:hypothetical protein